MENKDVSYSDMTENSHMTPTTSPAANGPNEEITIPFGPPLGKDMYEFIDHEFKLMTRNLVFRQFDVIKNVGNLRKMIAYELDDGSMKERILYDTQNGGEFDSLNQALEWTKNNPSVHVDKYFSWFEGQTSKRSLRGDIYNGHYITMTPHGFSQPEYTSKGFGLSHSTECIVPKSQNDIICGYVAERADGRGLYFKKWFISSRQFFKLWTLYWAPSSPALRKELCEAGGVRNFALTGSHLTTSNFAKWKKTMEENGENWKEQHTEINRRKAVHYYERVAIESPHFYPGLYLLLNGEMLCKENIPKNKKGPVPQSWYVSEKSFLEKFLQ